MRILLGLFIGLLAMGLTVTEMACDGGSGSDGDSDADACIEWCDKAFGECADVWVDDHGHDESEVEDILAACEDDCEPDPECEGWHACHLAAYDAAGLDECTEECDGTAEVEAYNECVMALECADMVEIISAGDNACQDELDDLTVACNDISAACNEALGALSTEEYDALMEALAACDEEFDCGEELELG